MKKNYNKKLIWDYINGKQILNVDKLEKDYHFMMEVIKITKDKNMYNLCSEEIKLNHEFIKFIIDIFKNDKKFIMKITKEYIQKIGEKDIRSLELIFLICDLIKNNKEYYRDETISFFIKIAIKQIKENFNLKIKLNDGELSSKGEIGLGFKYIISSDLGKSKIITRYFAKYFLNEIFYLNEQAKLEKIIHTHFISFEQLQELGIKQYILNYVSYLDNSLADYLRDNIELIKKIESNINEIGLNWNNYLTNAKLLKYEQFELETNKLIEEYNANFSFEEMCLKLDKINFDIIMKVYGNSSYDKNIEDYIDEAVSYITEGNNTINDYQCLHEIIKLAKNIYTTSDKEEFLERREFNIVTTTEKEQAKARVINFMKMKTKIKK